MELRNICDDIAVIIEKILYGQVDFKYDNLMCVMNPRHPADILDDILGIIGWDVFDGKTPPRANAEQMFTQLKDYKKTFKVKELNKPIKNLKNYLEGIQDE